MTFRLFVQQFLIISILCIVSMISFNFYKNEFGLFGDARGMVHKVHAYERTSKYLFSFNYVPKNFDGILVGPSLSDIEMNTKNIDNNRIYNLSINGGNISELKYLIDNILKYGNIKTFVICLDPYITKDNGRKSSSINPKEYYSSLGSIFTFKYYLHKLIIKNENNKAYNDSYWGYRHNPPSVKNLNSSEEIDKFLFEIEKKEKHEIIIDKTAYSELKEVLSSVRKKGIKIIGYFYPQPKRVFNNKYYQESYSVYRSEINKLLNYDNDVIIDFALDKYDYIRDNDSSYSDKSHLSKTGGIEVIKVLNKYINKN